MKTALLTIFGGFILLIVLLGVLGVASYVKYHDYGVATEAALVAQHKSNRQLLAKHSAQIVEMSQVSTMYKDDLREVYEAAVEGRYGENGSGAIMQWIQEHNPNMEASLYMRISQKVEANRDEFSNAQKVFIDKLRVYETNLGTVWSGFWLKLAGFPKTDLSELRVVYSTHSNKAFETGVDDGIQLRQ